VKNPVITVTGITTNRRTKAVKPIIQALRFLFPASSIELERIMTEASLLMINGLTS
jgi:hypothetical protein